ncbi:MAG: hypothetical protein U9R50_00705 [Campylobacterota bacterium]|nr:hypothetical protein [Campylobacterota bacterium]
MKRLGKLFIYLIVTLLLILFFLPKINLYYQAEVLLQKYKVTISQEKLSDKGFSFLIEEGVIYFDDLVVAKIDEVSIIPLLLYNSVTFSPFSFSEDMKRFIPLGIENLNITHSVVNPLHVKLEGSGDFGSLEGDIGLYERNISLVLNPSPLLIKQKPFWIKRMKKTAEGGYRYESTY